MANFFSILNKILKEADRINKSSKEKSNAQTHSKQNFDKSYQAEVPRAKSNEQMVPLRNKYIVSTIPIQARFIFYEIYDRIGSLNEFTVFAIKNQLRIHEVESYLSINRSRYLEKLSKIYGKQISFKEISLEQKLEILKGFKSTIYKGATCEIDFFRASNRAEMIFLLEFDLQLLNKYSWIIDDLGGQSYQDTWYWLRRAPVNEIVFMNFLTPRNDLCKILEVREALHFIFEPPIKYLIDKLSFSVVRERFYNKGMKVTSREQAKLVANSQNFQSLEVFTTSDLIGLNGRFYRMNSSFLTIAKEFESLQEFWKIVYAMI